MFSIRLGWGLVVFLGVKIRRIKCRVYVVYVVWVFLVEFGFVGLYILGFFCSYKLVF